MKALFTSIPASDYPTSRRFYEEAVGLRAMREFEGRPHRFTDYDLGGRFARGIRRVTNASLWEVL